LKNQFFATTLIKTAFVENLKITVVSFQAELGRNLDYRSKFNSLIVKGSHVLVSIFPNLYQGKKCAIFRQLQRNYVFFI